MVNPDAIKQMEAELFTPALQAAALKAKEQGQSKADTVYAIANAYANLLIPFLGGKKAAEDFLQQQLDYLRSQD